MPRFPRALFVFIFVYVLKKIMGKTTDEPFWITAELLSVHFKKGCLTTGICFNPAFKLSTGISEIREKIGIDWDVNEVLEKKTPKQLITYWPKGDYNHVFVEASVSGIDPQYSFPRLCDNAPGKQAFKASLFATSFDEEIWNSVKPLDNDIKLVTLNGHCFNATVSVRKHLKYCPWCLVPDENSIEVEPSERASFWSLSSTTDRLSSYLIMIFGLITFLTTTSFVILLLLHLRQRRKIYKDAISELNTTTRTIGSESQWSGIFVDQKCRPILRYVPTSHVEGKYGGGTMMIRPMPEKIIEDSQEGYEVIDIPPRPHVRIPFPKRDRHRNFVEFHDYMDNSSASSYCSPISSTISKDPTPQTSPNMTICEEPIEAHEISETHTEKDKDSGLHSISPEREQYNERI